VSQTFARGEEGQALIVVGLAMLVLMAALALSIDWGFGLVTRRVEQNQADAAALAVGRLLGSTYVGGAVGFESNQEDAWCAARDARNANRGATATTVSDVTEGLDVSFSADGTTWSDPITKAANCSVTNPLGIVPSTTAYVRVRASARYRSLLGAPTRQELEAAATARVRLTAGATVRPLNLSPLPPTTGLSGGTAAPSVAIWPLALHFNASDFALRPCGQYCSDPGRLMTLLDTRVAAPLGGFHGLVTFGHYSIREAAHQILTESDYRGTNEHRPGQAAQQLLNKSAGQCGITWDTKGSKDPLKAVECDVPNWFYYGFGGSIGVGTDWADPRWDLVRANSELPTALRPKDRSSCSAPPYFNKPSCTGGSSRVGDWIETVTLDTPAISSDIANQMRQFVRRYGRDAAGTAAGYGKAVVVNVLLWDCAENYDDSRPTEDRWNLIVPIDGNQDGQYTGDSRDCSALNDNTRVDRVHTFTMVPFTFYEGLIRTTSTGAWVQAYWGDVFGEPGFSRTVNGTYASCATVPPGPACQLNPLMNSAFLVPDE